MTLCEITGVGFGDAQRRRSGHHNGGGIVSAGVGRSSARHIHMVHLRRTRVPSHVHRDSDRLIATRGSQCVAAIATCGGGTRPARSGHRHRQQPGGRRLGYRHGPTSRSCAICVRHSHCIGGILLPLSEVACVGLADAEQRWRRSGALREDEKRNALSGSRYANTRTLICDA